MPYSKRNSSPSFGLGTKNQGHNPKHQLAKQSKKIKKTKSSYSEANLNNEVHLIQASTWVASFGFTMAFGALFSKTWRVHRIFVKKTQRMVSVKVQF